MKKMANCSKLLLLNVVVLPFIALKMNAQIAGNQVYGNENTRYTSYDRSTPAPKTTGNPNELLITVKVLENKKAAGFVLTLGLNQEEPTVAVCSAKINERISNFTKKLAPMGIQKDQFYVDFIAQTKIYDFDYSETKASQVETGFEIKKNIIITTQNGSNLEKIIALAANFEIYDIISVAYFDTNYETIHENLFQKALEIAEIKKNRYLKAFGKKCVGTPNATEDFDIIFPKTQYKTYQAFESSELQTNYNSKIPFQKKLERKNKTFYYEGVNTASYDLVLRPEQTEVGLQYSLTLQVSYKLDTSF